jgi:predicted Zn-dependent peptidase
MYQVSKLGHGLTVATAQMPHMSSVSLGIWVGVGSRYEPAERNGVCHFIEHLLFKGTRKRTAHQISQAVEGIGGYLNAFTSEENTCFHARASHRHFDDLLDVLMDMLLHSRFLPEDVDKEREVVKEEVSMCLDEPQHLVQEVLNALVWEGHPLGRPITGTFESLDGLKRPQLVDWLKHNYVTGTTVVVATGRVTHREVRRAVGRYAGSLSRGTEPFFIPAESKQSAPGLRLVTRKTEQTQLALGIRTCSRHDRRRFALRLINTMLGENMSSRLFQVVREDRGLAYSIYSTPSFFADTGDLVISAGLDAEKLPEVIRLIVQELRRFREKRPSPSELRRARDYVIGQIELGSESTEAQMNWLGEHLLGYKRILSPSHFKSVLRKISGAEIQAAAQDFFQPERLNLALVSPLKSCKHLEKPLSQLR